MLFDNAFVTCMNAQEVANIIDAFRRGEHGDTATFKLDIEQPNGAERRTLWVRPTDHLEPYTLVTGMEIVKCVTDDGETLDVIVPTENREFVFALVLTSPTPAVA